MVERGVPVVFRPENPRQRQSARSAGARDHSNAATNEGTSNSARHRRTGNGAPRLSSELPTHLRKRLPDEPRLKRAGTLFALLADHQRLKILLVLKAGNELCVGEVARVLGVGVSVASHHLRKLRDLGIVEDRGAGKLAYYSLQQRFVADLALAVLTRCL